MQSKSVLTLAALSAVCLLPASGIHAQQTGGNASGRMGAADAAPSGSVMDVAQFRESLSDIRELFRDIRESRTLSLATNDQMLQARYTEDTKHKLHQAQGLLDEISMNWKRSNIPGAVGGDQVGSDNMRRYAAESDDTAFVRNTVWQLQSMLQGDKLNGRGAVVSDQMMSMIDAAIQRAENPSFRVARAFNRDRLAQRIEFSRREEVSSSAGASASAAAPATESITRTETETTTRTETPAPTSEPEMVAETMTEETTEVAAAPTTSEEIATSSDIRAGAADLPQTGGDPGSLLLLGSSLMGAGIFLRRRKR